MYDDYIIDRQKDLVENPTARLPEYSDGLEPSVRTLRATLSEK